MSQKSRTPAYGNHKASGQARVRLDGQDHYLGAYDSPESKRRYAELIDRWQLRQRSLLLPSLTLGQLSLLYVEWANGYYVKNGKPTTTVAGIRAAVKPLMELYRTLDVADFGPLKLRDYQEHLVAEGVQRDTVNKYTSRVRRMVKWAVAREKCTATVLAALQTVEGLQAGRTEAAESAGVEPVDLADVGAVEGHIGRQLWGAIQYQLHTGCRPGEVLIVRACDIDMTGDVWTYTPASHKTEHHGKRRRILIGPKAQGVVLDYLTTETTAYLFGVEGTDRPYRRHSYTVGVRRACVRAGIEVWKPNQLRHTAATRIRKAADVETASTALGHSDIRITEVYAERNEDKAKAVVAKIG